MQGTPQDMSEFPPDHTGHEQGVHETQQWHDTRLQYTLRSDFASMGEPPSRQMSHQTYLNPHDTGAQSIPTAYHLASNFQQKQQMGIGCSTPTMRYPEPILTDTIYTSSYESEDLFPRSSHLETNTSSATQLPMSSDESRASFGAQSFRQRMTGRSSNGLVQLGSYDSAAGSRQEVRNVEHPGINPLINTSEFFGSGLDTSVASKNAFETSDLQMASASRWTRLQRVTGNSDPFGGPIYEQPEVDYTVRYGQSAPSRSCLDSSMLPPPWTASDLPVQTRQLSRHSSSSAAARLRRYSSARSSREHAIDNDTLQVSTAMSMSNSGSSQGRARKHGPYFCECCGDTYHDAKKFERHRCQRFPCTHCDATLSRKEYVNRHLKKGCKGITDSQRQLLLTGSNRSVPAIQPASHSGPQNADNATTRRQANVGHAFQSPWQPASPSTESNTVEMAMTTAEGEWQDILSNLREAPHSIAWPGRVYERRPIPMSLIDYDFNSSLLESVSAPEHADQGWHNGDLSGFDLENGLDPAGESLYAAAVDISGGQEAGEGSFSRSTNGRIASEWIDGDAPWTPSQSNAWGKKRLS